MLAPAALRDSDGEEGIAGGEEKLRNKGDLESGSHLIITSCAVLM